MTSKLTRLTDDELTETLRLATSGYPLPACVEGNLRQAFAELQERRKADSEPVAKKVACWSCKNEVEISAIGDCDGYCPICNSPIDLDEEPYTAPQSAQPAPVVTFYRDGIEAAANYLDKQRESFDNEHGQFDPDTNSFEFGSLAAQEHSDTLAELAEGIRALHPNAGNSPVIPGAEQRIADAVELLKQAAPAMLADNSNPDGPLVGRLKSPVIPDGYVMVPKEPTDEMIAAAMNCDDVLFNSDESFCVQFGNIYEAMLAAAPQSPGSEPATVPGKWIPVSEQLPDDDDFVYIWPRPDFGVELHVGQYCECSPKGEGWYAQIYEQNYGVDWHPITVTHWMPLPAAPQEVKS